MEVLIVLIAQYVRRNSVATVIALLKYISADAFLKFQKIEPYYSMALLMLIINVA